MTFTFREARRENVPLLILIAGGTASGKTESAMRIATGLAGEWKEESRRGQPRSFAVIDTENGRALHKADDYHFQHANLTEPFTPERYSEAVKAADEQGFPVIVIDSGSHEYEGVGGVLDLQAAEFERMGRKESARMSSWIIPKQRHKRFVQDLLRVRAHVILCLRAEDKIEIVKDSQGKTVVRPKESLVGAQGWIPICEKRLPFEATISLLLTADAQGVPKPIKLERRHRDLVPLDRPLDEEVGKALAVWAAGGLTEPVSSTGNRSDATMTHQTANTALPNESPTGSVNPRSSRLTEPGARKSESAAADVNTPSQTPEVPGSVSPLQELKNKAHALGVSTEKLSRAWVAMFPDKRPAEATQEEADAVWAAVSQEQMPV